MPVANELGMPRDKTTFNADSDNAFRTTTTSRLTDKEKR